MFKKYHFKWFFGVTCVLTVLTMSSILLRYNSFKQVSWWEYPEYVLQLSLSMLCCWLIHGSFILNKNSKLIGYTKSLLSIMVATLATFSLSFALYTVLPHTVLIENGVQFASISDFIVHLIGAFLASLIIYVIFYSIHTNSALQSSKLENELLEQAHLRAQLLSLQQQISPHFLFNSLSTLKTIATDDHTKNYVMQLARVYRYVLNFNEYYLTPLNDELTFIKSYLYILNERFEDALIVKINIPEKDLIFFIPPLSLQLLIENAVKHNGISPERPLRISIYTDDSPSLIVTNNFQPKKKIEEGTGTGLKNIAERYKLLINKSIQVVDDGVNFSVTLPLINK